MPVGLVLEGGGIRGAYTAGVLDVLARENFPFSTVYGISAGACNALSFLSGQIGRNREIFAQYIQDKRYVSFGNLVRGGSLFGFNFIFGELFHELLPFDYDAFFSNPIGYQAGATDLETGKIRSLVVPGRLRLFGLLGREEDRLFPWEAVRRFGEDIILVETGGPSGGASRGKKHRG